ncbi:RDD family protein [Agromyces subbeticus]|uniref:RDD family protein n=1 Tax=Agromyces subbeticus TaxID=293890 RepID=UPI0003B78692|nr:RDD family protein [Agromyces subbeticus]
MSITLDVEREPVPGLDPSGRPDPAYAERLGLVPAPRGRRSAAFALDALIWLVLAAPGAVGVAQLAGGVISATGDVAAVFTADMTLPLVLTAVSQGALFVFGLVQIILHGRMSMTIGKAAFGIRSVGVAEFGAPGFWRIVLRTLVLWASQVLIPVIGPAVLFASSTWDPEARGRSWLDRIGRCFAIDIRSGLNPLDPRALRHARRAMDAPVSEALPTLPSLASGQTQVESLFIPATRSSSGVVSAAPTEAVEWTPPALGPAQPTNPPASPAPAAQILPTAPHAQVGSPAPPAPSHPARPVGGAFVLIFDDGTRLPASAFGLFGRAPVPAAGEPADQLIPLDDPTMRISKTHAAFGADAAGFWVIDRDSRNGTAVSPIGGRPQLIEPGVRTPVPAGSRVTLGGRSFIVTEEPGR